MTWENALHEHKEAARNISIYLLFICLGCANNFAESQKETKLRPSRKTKDVARIYREQFIEYAKLKKFDPLVAENWYSISSSSFDGREVYN